MAISFSQDDIQFVLREKQRIRQWITRVVQDADKRVGEIAYVFCSDETLLRYNRQFLNHDTYTDIITFDYVSGDVVSGDIIISVDRVRDNAAQLGNPFIQELHRVLIHGVLHLLGQGDKSEMESQEMRAKEEAALSLYEEL
ncbi:MAG: rRNA maturation RNase YbeY [Bacteroidales bacterium]|nr:rRNA maturation RNase YbeY [Bacteroidales bacterium]